MNPFQVFVLLMVLVLLLVLVLQGFYRRHVNQPCDECHHTRKRKPSRRPEPVFEPVFETPVFEADSDSESDISDVDSFD